MPPPRLGPMIPPLCSETQQKVAIVFLFLLASGLIIAGAVGVAQPGTYPTGIGSGLIVAGAVVAIGTIWAWCKCQSRELCQPIITYV
jgi:hypothetical protein